MHALANRLEQQRTLSRYLRAFFVVMAVATAVNVLAWLQIAGDMRDLFEWAFDPDRLASEDPPTLSGYASLLLQLGALASWGLAALEIAWLWRSTDIARSLGLTTRRSPGLAGFSFVIPVVNLWWPYQSVTDLFPPAHNGRREVGWWWGLTLGAGFVGLVTNIGALLSTSWALIGVLLTIVLAVEAAVRGRRMVTSVQATHDARFGEIVQSAAQRPS